MTDYSKLEHVRILVIGKTPSSEFHRTIICEKKLLELNLLLIRVARYNVCSMADFSHEN